MPEVIFYGLFITLMVLGLGLVWIVQQYRASLDALSKARKEIDVTDEIEKLIEDTSLEFKSEIHQSLTKSAQVIEKQMTDALEAFRQDLATKAASFEETFAKKVDEEFTGVSKELEEYRKKRFDEINQEVERLIKDITQEALGRTLTPKDHEELVLKALEKYNG